jgi:aerotolerance regulator-like protein
MTFLNISLLAGTAFVALPVVLHLIMRRRPRHLEFPALRFIQRQHNTNQRRLRLRHLILLALRAAAIALLALALARPSVKLSGTHGSEKAPVAAALVFDTGKRMEYRHQNLTRLEAAQEWGDWLVGRLHRESQVAILDTSLTTAAFQVDRKTALHRLEQLSTVANSQPLERVLEKAVRLLGESQLPHKEVYIFTDMARASWPVDLAGQLQDSLAGLSDVGVFIVDVGIEEPVNSSLGEPRLSSQIISTKSPLEIEIEVYHSGPEVERSVNLYLSQSDRSRLDQTGPARHKRSQQIVALQPGGSQTIGFTLEGLEQGTHQGLIEIVGQDGLDCDNRRFFTVEVKPAWRVLMVAPSPPERHAIYLTEAVAPASFRRSGRARFDCHVIAFEELSKAMLEDYAAVCLLDPAPLGADTWEKLANYASAGHGVAVFLGRNAAPTEPFNSPAAQELLAGKLIREARTPEGYLSPAPRVTQHPILSELAKLTDTVPWSVLPVYRYWQLGPLAEGTHVVVPYSDQRPAILDRPLGEGRVLTVTTPVSDPPVSDSPNDGPWNLLPVGEPTWPFVILADGMMSYLVGSSQQQLNYLVGQTAVLRLDPKTEHRSYGLTAPDNVRINLTPDLGRHLLMIASTDSAGHYRVTAGGSRPSGVDQGFSVNLAPEQTELERMADEDLAEVFGPHDYHLARNREELEGKVSYERVGRQLFSMLIILVAAVLGIEHVMANRFYRE